MQQNESLADGYIVPLDRVHVACPSPGGEGCEQRELAGTDVQDHLT